MLNVGPWYRLPLTVRWLDDDFYTKYSFCVSPPMHMPITHGPVISKKLNVNKNNKKSQAQPSEPQAGPSIVYCLLCDLPVEDDDKITCVIPGCPLIVHIICLAENFRKDDMILPIDGDCPACNTNVLWGDLIRKMIGCNLHLSEDYEDLGENFAVHEGNIAEIIGENNDCDSSDDIVEISE